VPGEKGTVGKTRSVMLVEGSLTRHVMLVEGSLSKEGTRNGPQERRSKSWAFDHTALQKRRPGVHHLKKPQ